LQRNEGPNSYWQARLGPFVLGDRVMYAAHVPRYRELFARRQARKRSSAQDLRDLQMWFNLAWFGNEFREGAVTLATGEVASVRPFVEQGRGFSADDIRAMVDEQYKILRAVIHFRCTYRGCSGRDICCRQEEHRVALLP